MSSTQKWGEILFILFLSFFINSCTRPEDNAITPIKQNIPLPAAGTKELSSGTLLPKIYTIEISGMKFHPDEITVHKGDTIIWKNNDLVVHCVTEIPGNVWTSSKIPSGKSWKMVANASANYFCAIHLVMKGKIIVE